MADVTSTDNGNGKLIAGIIIVLLVLLFLTAGVVGFKYILAFFENSNFDSQPMVTDLNLPDKVDTTFDIFLGKNATESVQSFIMYLAMFFMFFFAFYDIISSFSTFSKYTSFAITSGLVLVMGISGVFNRLAVFMGMTATYGAVAIAVIIVYAITLAVVMNLFLGPQMMRYKTNKMKQQMALEAEVGTQAILTGMDASGLVGLKAHQIGKKAAADAIRNPK